MATNPAALYSSPIQVSYATSGALGATANFEAAVGAGGIGGLSRGVYIGTAGNVNVTFADGTTGILYGLSGYLPVSWKNIIHTDTTAQQITAFG